MKKRNILTLTALAVSGITLASCSNSTSTSVNTDAYNTNIAKTWFANGEDTSSYDFSSHYTTKIYDPSLDEGFNSTSYYSLYTYSDVESMFRMTKTEISSSAFDSNKSSYINYLECSAFNSTYQTNFTNNIKEASISLPSYASCQTTWQKSLLQYGLTSTSLEDGEANYLYVIYMPVYVRVYSDSKVSIGSFICVPVYATISLDENTTTNETVKAFASKIVSPEYSGSIIK